MIATTPAFVMIPESRAEAGAGAIGWAVGSQPCMGYIPALVPNPMMPTRITIKASCSCPAIFALSRKPP